MGQSEKRRISRRGAPGQPSTACCKARRWVLSVVVDSSEES